MATQEQLQTWLTEAEQALHDLNIGGTVVKLKDASGDEVEYSKADVRRLESYIASLKAQLGQSGKYRAIGVLY